MFNMKDAIPFGSYVEHLWGIKNFLLAVGFYLIGYIPLSSSECFVYVWGMAIIWGILLFKEEGELFAKC